MKNLVVIILSAVMLGACGQQGGKKEPEKEAAQPVNESEVALTADQAKNAGIVTGKPELKDIASVLRVNGVVDVPPQNMVSISMPLGGYVKSMALLPGMHVSKGQVLAVMEDPQYIQLQQDYLMAKAKMSAVESEYKRQQELNKTKATSDKQFQQAEAENRSQRVLVRSLSEKLKLLGVNPDRLSDGNISRSVNIYAPITGYVSKVLVNPGKYVAATDVLFELVNPTDIHLALTVFEKDVPSLFIGQRVTAFTNNDPDKKHTAKIILIGRDLSAERNVAVHCHFDEYDKTLVPGTFMNATIEVQSKNLLTLPEDAIVRYENKQYAFVVSGNNHFKMTELETGEAENGYVSVKDPSGNLSAQNFVIKGAYSLLMKMKNTEDE